jgi:hypothetical protein
MAAVAGRARGSAKGLVLACAIFLQASRSAQGCVSHHGRQLPSQQQVRLPRSPFRKRVCNPRARLTRMLLGSPLRPGAPEQSSTTPAFVPRLRCVAALVSSECRAAAAM